MPTAGEPRRNEKGVRPLFREFRAEFGVRHRNVFGIGHGTSTDEIPRHEIRLWCLTLIFALLAFGQLFGFFGVLLALPASAVLLVGLKRLRAAYVASAFYAQA